MLRRVAFQQLRTESNPRPGDFIIKLHEFTHIGQRSENQDRLKILRSPDNDEILLVVADGLGGHRGGALAARTVVETAESCWNSRPADLDAEPFLNGLVRQCHDAVSKAGDEQSLDPLSTLAALLVRGGNVTSIHVGDSRVMQFSETGLSRRTLDHSLAQLDVLRGVITEEEMATHPDQARLFSVVGGEDAPEAPIEHWNLEDGRRFVVCSDGFWEIFSPREILEVFAATHPRHELEARFSKKLDRLRGHDNTTAILAEVAAPKRRWRRLLSRAFLPALLFPVFVAAEPESAVPPAARIFDAGAGQGERNPGTVIREDETTPGRKTTESTASDQATEESPRTEQAIAEDTPVPLDRVDIELGRGGESGSSVSEVVAEALRKAGGIGAYDTLEPTGGERLLGGKTIVRLRQKHKGIPVFAAEMVAVRGDGRIAKIQGYSAPAIEVDTRPVNDYPTTIKLCGGLTGQSIKALTDGILVIFRLKDGRYRLAWEGVVLIDRGEERTLLDAETGEILLRLPVTLHGLERRVYDFGAACREARVRRKMRPRRSLRLVEYAMKTHVRSDVSPPGNVEVERLFKSFGDIYRFLNVGLEMDSFDGHGAALRGFVGMRFHPRAQTPQCTGDHFNSFWHTGLNALFLPNAALDYSEVIGHEIGHGIVQSGSGLIYQSQPGALNEAIADAVGVTFRAWLENGSRIDPRASIPGRIWKLRQPGGVIRDMKHPASLVDPLTGRPYPDHFDDYRNVDADNGGVHVNSSILNQGYYLLAMGGRHPRRGFGPEVQGVGLSKAMRIFGRAGADLLTPNSGFIMARYAFAEVARILYGDFSREWVASHTAMDAIGIPGDWPRPPPPPAPPKPVPPPEQEENPAPEPQPAPDPGGSDPLESQAESESKSAPEPEPAPPSKPAPPRKPSPRPKADPVSAPDPGPGRSVPSSPEPEKAPRPDKTTDLWIVAALLLIVGGVLFVVVRSRPGKRWMTEKTAVRTDEVPSRDTAGGGQQPPAPLSTDVVPCRLAASLIALDGSPPIPLRRDLLTSAEGLVIGRAKELCHVEIRDPQVSRRHLRLRLADEAVWIEDLNSLKGTEVDGNRMEPFKPVRLRSTHVVRIAGLSFRFEFI